jgi:4-amino-4-deoxy-L-arabinose transferase-like glycosyltransferase
MLWKIFFAAVAIRWAYCLLLFALMGDAGLQGIDSIGYLANAHNFAGAVVNGSLHGWEWFGSSTIVMPFFLWLLALNSLSFGALAPLSYVLMQGVIDAGTCLLVYGIARSLDPRYALPAAIAATLNPTQIVLSALVYTDTPFVFFVAVFLFASVWWLREPSWRWAALVGFGLGAATMIRALAAFWAPVLLLFLLVVTLGGKRLSRQISAQLLATAMVFGLCIAPVLWRNISQFGAWSLTSQAGTHLALWVVPLVKEARDGTPWQQSYNAMQRRIQGRFPAPTANPFEQSRRSTQIAREALPELGFAAIAKAWLTGAAINLASPAIILSPPVSHLPHVGFYGTPGASPFEKISNFLFRSDNAIYAWILIAGVAGVAAIRLIQLAGLFAALREGNHAPVLWLFALWFFYILAINGPVASPKYRLPLEPPFAVLTGAGLVLLRHRAT